MAFAAVGLHSHGGKLLVHHLRLQPAHNRDSRPALSSATAYRIRIRLQRPQLTPPSLT
jgi:hypothetical protein